VKDYHSTHMVTYESPEAISSDVLEVLPFLKGRSWDQLALNYVHSLQPSSIRVTRGECKTDWRSWRVTVFVNEHDVILKIEQEADVGCIGYASGYDMHLMSGLFE